MTLVLCVTGTDTGVGKTVATAALACAFAAHGARVHIDKPVQTGVAPAEPGDMGHVRALAGRVSTSEGLRLREPMAPIPAAAIDGVGLPTIAAHAERLRSLADGVDVLLVEGVGGLLVRLDAAAGTFADLAAALDAPVVVVTRAALGTLNHTELTLEAIARRGIGVAGLVIGAWPATPGPVETTNREHLAGLAAPFLGAIPGGAGAWDGACFQAAAPGWLELPAP
ncbi:MAG: dethiobiotin synthase [Tetrasphaera sp.]